ncbi:MAG: sugar transferase [Candidatus Omnitrophota bacterium]
MLKEQANIFRKTIIFADILLVLLSFILAYFLGDETEYGYTEKVYFNLLVLALIFWTAALYFFGMYTSFRTRKIAETVGIVIKSAFFCFIAFISCMYLLKLDIHRTFIIFLFASSAFFISLEKIITILFFRYIRKRGYNYRKILLIGTGQRAQRFINLVHKHSEWGLRIVGLIDADATKVNSSIDGYKVMGTFDDLPKIVHDNVVDEAVFVVPRSWIERIEKMMHFCETEGIRISVAVDYFNLKFSRQSQTDFDGFPLLTFESAPSKMWHLFIKRLFDIVLSSSALIMLIPVFIVVSFFVKVTSSGPIFFKQKRCGLNGRKFVLYKFRTMSVDAEEKLEELLKHNEMSGPVFKMKNDPRLTVIGKFLRKTSLDELPQLWNILKGDMSLVGPRPPIPAEVQKYDNWQRRRLSMRPGITCLWQVSGRNKITDFNQWMKLDLDYIDRWSLWLDFKILINTIPVVLFGVGAK